MVSLLFALPLLAGSQLDTELRRIDAWASDSDTRLVMISAMADDLRVHRNHLILLRKQSGEPYSRIFVAALEKSGLEQNAILVRAAALGREVERRLRQSSPNSAAALTVSTGADHSSAGTFFWLTPEFGIGWRRGSVHFGVPYYRNSNGTAAAGLGDAYLAGAVYGRVARTELEGALTLGLPTGDKNRGLGAGKVTADVTGTVARSFEQVRPFFSAGFANSIFNFAYQRPFIADGNAAHFSGGVEFRAARLTAGMGGFSVRPFGSQTVYSRVMMEQPADRGRMQSAGMMPRAQANELVDHGANGWMSLMIARGVFLHAGLARSVPFHLTTARVGLRFDLGRLLFR